MSTDTQVTPRSVFTDSYVKGQRSQVYLCMHIILWYKHLIKLKMTLGNNFTPLSFLIFMRLQLIPEEVGYVLVLLSSLNIRVKANHTAAEKVEVPLAMHPMLEYQLK